jgi:hypothetical protein
MNGLAHAIGVEGLCKRLSGLGHPVGRELIAIETV